MSCPYLERGWIARCFAFGNEGMEVPSADGAIDCFSGEFSQCPFLVLAFPAKLGRKGRKRISELETLKNFRLRDWREERNGGVNAI